MPRRDEIRSRRVLAIWLPRWPVQRRLLERPELRDVPVFVCRRGRRGTLSVVSWAWALPPRGASGRRGPGGGRGAHIPPGMTLAEAMAVLALSHGSRACHVAVVDHDDPAADRAALVQVARWCRRFSPTCGLEMPACTAPSATAEPPLPECIHLDVTGTAGFFGGEAALARTVVWTLAARGLHARVAIADTASAARAAARHTDLVPCPSAETAIHGPALLDRRRDVSRKTASSDGAPAPSADVRTAVRLPRSRAWWKPSHRKRRWAVVPPGEMASVLADLPVSALQLDRDTLALLRELGIESIGAMLRLPVDRLAARFPPQVARCRARLLGTLAEPWARLTARTGTGLPAGDPDTADDELPRAVETFDVPVALDDLGEQALVAVVERLLQQCVVPLAARGEGVLTLQVRLEGSIGRAPAVLDMGLFRPSCSIPHLIDLVRLRMGRCRPPRELAAIAVEVVAAGTALCRQRSLFTADTAAGDGETAESQTAAVGMLLDRLCGRLGRSAVFVPCAVADPQPEHAWVAASPLEVAAAAEAQAVRPIRGAGRSSRRPADRAAAMPRRHGAGGAVHGAATAPIGSGEMPRSRGWNGPAGGRRPIWMPLRPVPLELPRHTKPIPVPRPDSMPFHLEPAPTCSTETTPARAAGAPDAPPTRFWLHDRWHRVAHAHGPERIETAWWRGPTVRRDYYVVETVSGERFWLFHCRRDGRWFLHGIFA